MIPRGQSSTPWAPSVCHRHANEVANYPLGNKGAHLKGAGPVNDEGKGPYMHKTWMGHIGPYMHKTWMGEIGPRSHTCLHTHTCVCGGPVRPSSGVLQGSTPPKRPHAQNACGPEALTRDTHFRGVCDTFYCAPLDNGHTRVVRRSSLVTHTFEECVTRELS